ncbi:sigma-E processing peptidase SpoIIGA [Thalassobacillus hwangdonensis]|uniref:Sporulation sigma-E factor-processing peptidase n=1 Tax=Thalassobacillus hwangdonensis TaxID=546108 RepID=A0ABW3KWP9_9BACI
MIYLDAVWMLNFLLDGMILFLTQAVTKANASFLRLMVGAFTASLIVPLTIFYPDTLFSTPIGKLLFSVVIILTAFQFQTLRMFFRNLVSFYFITFAIGGALFGSHYFIQSNVNLTANGMVTFNSGYGDPVSWFFVLVGFPIAWWFTRERLERITLLKMKYEEIYPVVIEYAGKKVESKGLVDSGNQLIDPLTKKLVFLADESVFKRLIEERDWELLKEVSESFQVDQLPGVLQERVTFVPYQGAEGSGQLMLTLRVDGISALAEGTSILVQSPLLGIQFGEMTADGSYHVLLHPHMKQKGKVA